MAEHIKVPFELKSIAMLSDLKYDEKADDWYGTKAQIQTYNENKDRSKIIKDNINKMSTSADIDTDSVRTDKDTVWENIDITHTPNLQLISYVHDYGMPFSTKARVDLLYKFTLKNPTEYPVYYDDLIFYSPFFKKLYPRERVNALIIKFNISGRNLTDELSLTDLSTEEKALINFVFS